LRTYITKQGLRNQVRLLGAVANQRMPELMNAADVFFLPSRWEGIAASIYEAMACALPVVGADVGGQRELVTPECGVLVARGDETTEAKRYAEVLTTLLADRQRCRSMGEVGRRRVSSHFGLEQMGEHMAALLRNAMQLHVAQPRPVPSLALGQICAVRTVRYMKARAVLKRLLPSSYLDRHRKWLLPLKETIERVVLR
jgi:hypothetical protein